MKGIQKIDRLYNRLNRSKKIHESTLLIENGSGETLYVGEYHRTIDTPILVASITKLYTTAVIMKLIEANKIQLDDPIANYLDDSTLFGLHVLNGKDYSRTLTIDHLLTQTSGLPDYFFGKIKDSDSLLAQVIKEDVAISFDEKVHLTKQQNPHFIPSRKKRAYYSDINFDLLGKVIENVTGFPLRENYERYIFKPLNLTNTWLPEGNDLNRDIPHSFINDHRIHRPLFIQSCEASGGIISTTRELMTFLKAFWQGKLFDTTQILEAPVYRLQLSFFPIKYGRGFMHVTARYPFIKKRTLIGHSGSSGSFAFYSPDLDIYLTGDVAQNSSPAIPVRLSMRSVLHL